MVRHRLLIQIARRQIPAQPWASRIGFSPESLGTGPVRFFFCRVVLRGARAGGAALRTCWAVGRSRSRSTPGSSEAALGPRQGFVLRKETDYWQAKPRHLQNSSVSGGGTACPTTANAGPALGEAGCRRAPRSFMVSWRLGRILQVPRNCLHRLSRLPRSHDWRRPNPLSIAQRAGARLFLGIRQVESLAMLAAIDFRFRTEFRLHFVAEKIPAL